MIGQIRDNMDFLILKYLKKSRMFLKNLRVLIVNNQAKMVWS